MAERIHAPNVGAPDPELINSPFIEDTDYDYGVKAQVLLERDTCFFNGQRYFEGDYVCSGDELLRCTNGAWLRSGSCDPDNPD